MPKQQKTKIIILFTISIILSISTIFSLIYFNIPTAYISEQSQIKEADHSPNIVLLIGDGMGTEHIRLIKEYQNNEDIYSFETCPNTLISTNSVDTPSPTDSAASATAIATGHKVSNGVLSVEIPGSEDDLNTILEILKSKEYLTGLITTTEITHATPAAFASHTESRNNTKEIVQDYFSIKPDLIFGGLSKGYINYVTEDYNIAKNIDELTSLKSVPALGIFGSGGHMDYVKDRDTSTPQLLDMTKKAVSLLSTSTQGFFLMIEGGRIDHASHSNDTKKVLYELQEFMSVAEYLYTWASKDSSTILILTADHETGDLEVLESGNNEDEIPNVVWNSIQHTNKKVPLYICFDENVNMSNLVDNTDIFEYMNSL